MKKIDLLSLTRLIKKVDEFKKSLIQGYLSLVKKSNVME